MNDLMMVDDDNDPPMTTGPYVPKAHLGWASFGESIQPPLPVKTTEVQAPLKRKVYVIRQNERDKSKPYHIAKPKKEVVSSDVISQKPAIKSPPRDPLSTDSDEDVDVVGIDEEAARANILDVTMPPDLPPQPSFGSRLGPRSRKDHRLTYESDEEDHEQDPNGGFSPPPQLEPQTSDSVNHVKPLVDDDSEKKVENDLSAFEKHLVIDDVDSSQLLKTRVSSSAIPILPLSKSIMERKKVALELTKNAVIKKVNVPKPTFRNFSVAPKSVQIPAYSDQAAPMTLYSNVNRPGNIHKDIRGRCFRCREKSPVDMSSFKFVDDTTVVTVRAHLCDQTRVMIARTAVWNREYAKRLGDRAVGTVWQKPDEVTAQMTGFCSATVRRCIEIANLSIVPRCADRIGVSKNELTSLKTSFGNEKFFGQPMRTPHILTQYYAVKAQAAAAKASANGGPPPLPRMGKPPGIRGKDEPIDEEEERKHHPLTNYKPPETVKPFEEEPPQSSSTLGYGDSPEDSSASGSVPPLKKTVLRWTSIQTPRILRAPTLKNSVPRMAVIPVMKKKVESKKGEEEWTPSRAKKRGRPRKVKQPTVESVPPTTRSLRSRRKDLVSNRIKEDVQDTVEYLVNKVCEGTSNDS